MADVVRKNPERVFVPERHQHKSKGFKPPPPDDVGHDRQMDVLDAACRNELVWVCAGARLVGIDTLRRFHLGDENDSAHMGTDGDISADAAAAGAIAGSADVRDGLITTSVRQIKSVCEKVQQIGSGSGSRAAQLKIITCMPEAVANAYAKDEGDYSGVNDSALSGFTGPGGAEMRQAKDLCLYPVEIPVKTWANQAYVRTTFLSEGLLTRNMRIMQTIFAKMIRGNQKLQDSEIAWINAAPMPVYKMLSTASLFPIQGLEMIQSQALMISALQTEAFVDRLINDAHRNTDPQLPIYEEDFEKVLAYLSSTSKVRGVILDNHSQIAADIFKAHPQICGQLRILPGKLFDQRPEHDSTGCKTILEGLADLREVDAAVATVMCSSLFRQIDIDVIPVDKVIDRLMFGDQLLKGRRCRNRSAIIFRDGGFVLRLPRIADDKIAFDGNLDRGHDRLRFLDRRSGRVQELHDARVPSGSCVTQCIHARLIDRAALSASGEKHVAYHEIAARRRHH